MYPNILQMIARMINYLDFRWKIYTLTSKPVIYRQPINFISV